MAPTAWPFFKRRSTSYPPVRTALGTVYDGVLGIGLIQLFGINLAAGDTLLVATANDATVATGSIAVDIDGNALTVDANLASSTALRGMVHRYFAVTPIVGGTITAQSSSGGSTNFGMVASKVSGLTGVLNESKTGQFTTTQNPQTVGTAVYPFVGFHYGFVCTNGCTADTLGTWLNSYTAGQRDGGAAPLSLDMKEGFRVINGVAARTQIQLQTSRRSVAITCNYGQ